MEKVIEMPRDLNINKNTFSFLSELQHAIINTTSTRIILDFCNCKFSHAIFTSFIGALLHIASENGKTVVYRSAHESAVQKYLKRSGLYNYIVNDEISYINDNAIPFRCINMDDEQIQAYIDNILALAPITLSSTGYELMFKNLYEIFNNSSEHSNAKCGVYGCGHWMPTKKQLVFSLYDTGIGIPMHIKNRINYSFSSAVAIKWAPTAGNSTEQLTGGIPRGLGLSDLKEFVRLNKGTLNIFSNDIYYNYQNGIESIEQFQTSILGTFIGIVIKADYDHIYIAK